MNEIFFSFSVAKQKLKTSDTSLAFMYISSAVDHFFFAELVSSIPEIEMELQEHIN